MNKTDEEGSAVLGVIAIMALVSVMALVGMTSVSVPMKVVNLDRREMECFYELEMGIDEMLEGVERTAEQAGEETYSAVVDLSDLELELEEIMGEDPSEYLKSFIPSSRRNQIGMELGEMEQNENRIIWKECRFWLEQEETGVRAEVTGDMVIRFPEVFLGEEEATETEITVSLECWERIS